MKLFAQIRKVDEAKRLVFGRLAQETVDKSDEIMDYESSKPYFKAWSDAIAKDTGGKSLGNLRAMHGKVAAGKFTAIDFNDAEKAIDVCAKVVDDGEWKKVCEGVYTGFSIGGSYVGDKAVEKVDGKDVTRYTANPSEGSLVDRPCIPTARFFEVQKADGTTARVDFVSPGAADDVTVNGTADEVAQLGKLMNERGLSLSQVIAKIAERKDADPKEGEEKYGKDADFADPTNKKYPLDTAAHVRAAASYFGQEKNRSKYSAADQKAIDAKIAAAKKKFGIGEEAPDKDKEKAEATAFAKAYRSELRKGMYSCSAFAQLIAGLQNLQESAEYETFREGDDSDLPDKLAACIAMCGSVLKDMIDEELEELSESANTPDPMTIALAEKCGALLKTHPSPLLTLVKVGARHSKDDLALVQGIHDHAAQLGAECPGASPGNAEPANQPGAGATGTGDGETEKVMGSAALQKALADSLAPLQKVIDEQAARIQKLEAQPAPARIALRAVPKGADQVEDPQLVAKTTAPVVDDRGEKHEAATLIKSIHASGGTPLALPQQLRK